MPSKRKLECRGNQQTLTGSFKKTNGYFFSLAGYFISLWKVLYTHGVPVAMVWCWSSPILKKTQLWLSDWTLKLSCSELEDCHLPLTLGCLFSKFCNPYDLPSLPALLRWGILAAWQIITELNRKLHYCFNERGNEGIGTVQSGPSYLI